MKSREKKQADLEALTENFKGSKSAMVLSFNKLTVEKDQEFRNELRETGIKYGVVKNTLARLAVKGTTFEDATEHFKGVSSVAWTNDEPVAMSKVVSKYIKENKDIFAFKTGVVEGRVVNFEEVKGIASLPSKDELIGKLLYLLNAPAQRFATVLNAIPRDLAVVVQQVSTREGDLPDAPAEAPAPEATEAPAEEAPKEEKSADSAEADTQEDEKAVEVKEEAPAAEEGSESEADGGEPEAK